MTIMNSNKQNNIDVRHWPNTANEDNYHANDEVLTYIISAITATGTDPSKRNRGSRGLEWLRLEL